MKCGVTGRFVVGGYSLHESTPRGQIAGLLLGLYRGSELVYVGGVGTGFDAKTRQALRERFTETKERPFDVYEPSTRRRERVVWVEPELIAECHYAELTDDGKVRHASFLGLREGDPRQCRFPGDATTGRRPKLTNAKKVFWPEDGLTKGDMFHYYETIAPVLLPHYRDRPMVLRRMPDGIQGDAFYQKNMGKEAPEWLRTVNIWSAESERDVRYAIVDDVGALLYCAQLGCIALSPWSSRVGSLENPDFAIFDLDPGDDCPFEVVVEVAGLVKAILDEIGLRSYVKTSGASGLHVQVPLEPVYTYEAVRTFAEIVASIGEKQRPDLITLVRAVKARPTDRLYLDYLQNVIGKTVVGPYTLRERPGAPVSTPLRWDEVRPGLDPRDHHMKNVPDRVAELGDLWRPMLEDKQRLEKALARLGKLAKLSA